MTFMEMRYLLAIEQYGNLTKAANACYVSQPALTQKLKALEDEFGAKLFRRESDGMRLTQAGQIVLNSVHGMLFAEQEMRQTMLTIKKNLETEISLVCQRVYCDSMRLYAEMLKKLKYLNRSIKIIPGNGDVALASLKSGTASMALYNTHLLPADPISYRVLHINEMFLAVSESSVICRRLRGTEDIWQEILKDETFLLHRSGSPARIYEDAALKASGFKPKHIMTIDGESDLRASLQNSSAIGFLPYIPGETGFYKFSLRPSFHFYTLLAWNTQNPPSRELCLLRDLLLFEYHGSDLHDVLT